MNGKKYQEWVVEYLETIGVTKETCDEITYNNAYNHILNTETPPVNNEMGNSNSQTNKFSKTLTLSNGTMGYTNNLDTGDNIMYKKAAYIDALVLALITGIFGGIFLTILFMVIK